MSKIFLISSKDRLSEKLLDISTSEEGKKWEWVSPDSDNLSLFRPSFEDMKNLLIVDCLDWENVKESFEGLKISKILTGNFLEKSEINICEESGDDFQAVIDMGNGIKFAGPIIKTIMKNNELLSQTMKLKNFGEDLNEMVNLSLGELQRVKKIHEIVVPLRSEKVKGLCVSSKFAAGESSGGEFFDLVKGDSEILVLLTSSKSYVASSIILSHFELLREKKESNKAIMSSFLEDLINELRDLDLLDRSKPDQVQASILRVDLKTMTIEGFSFGKCQISSTSRSISIENNHPMNENFFDKAFFQFKMERGESLAIFSPGVQENFRENGSSEKISEIVSEKLDEGAREFLDEIFFHLKRNLDGDFLKHDASVIYLEVDPHVIIQV